MFQELNSLCLQVRFYQLNNIFLLFYFLLFNKCRDHQKNDEISVWKYTWTQTHGNLRYFGDVLLWFFFSFIYNRVSPLELLHLHVSLYYLPWGFLYELSSLGIILSCLVCVGRLSSFLPLLDNSQWPHPESSQKKLQCNWWNL